MNKIKAWFFMMWRPTLAFLGVTLVVGYMFGFRLGNLTPGASLSESSYIAEISSGRDILKHPVYVVHKLPVYVLFKLRVHHLAAYRAVSAAFASLAVIGCFFVLR